MTDTVPQPAPIPNAADLHRDALVMDAASFFCSGYDDDIAASGVNAINLMVPWPSDDFAQAVDRIEAYYDLFAREPRLRQALSADDIPSAKAAGQVALVLGTQNAVLIGDRLSRLESLQRLGLRYLQLTYNERNFIGDGCGERDGAGLSNFGREAVKALPQVGIVMDLTHVGHRTAMDALELATAPAMISHANPRALYDNPRNHHDDVIRALADTGGIMCCTLPSPFNWQGGEAGPPTLEHFALAIEHVIELVGEDHVGVGSDFMATAGAYPAELSAKLRPDLMQISGAYYGKYGLDPSLRKVQGVRSFRDWPVITDMLLARGHGEDRVRKILGENLMRVYRAVWR